jgi:hypothetical protein
VDVGDEEHDGVRTIASLEHFERRPTVIAERTHEALEHELALAKTSNREGERREEIRPLAIVTRHDAYVVARATDEHTMPVPREAQRELRR